jgi:hypothetical protein
MAIWLCFIAKYMLVIWQHPIAKCTLGQFGDNPYRETFIGDFGNLLLLKQKR